MKYIASAMLVLAIASPAVAAPEIYGVWRNPKDTVHVEIRACDAGTCGYVVWATAKAQADAREGSGKELIGQQLFRNFVQDRNGVWRGKVYVPDMNKTFSGSAEVLDARTMRAKGCVLGLLCKTQAWTRVDRATD